MFYVLSKVMNRGESCPGKTSVFFQSYMYILKDMVTTDFRLIFKKAVIKIMEKKIIVPSDMKSFKIR